MGSMVFEKFCGYYQSKNREEMVVLKYRRRIRTSVVYCKCDKCGREISNEMYVFQSIGNDAKHMCVCNDCGEKAI